MSYPIRRARCIECGGKTRLVPGSAIYPGRPEFHHQQFWRCQCGAYVGCHPDTTRPLGSAAGPDTRAARKKAHDAFDQLWKPKRGMSRGHAYEQLANHMGLTSAQCHIALFNQDQCQKVIEFVELINRMTQPQPQEFMQWMNNKK